MITEFKADDVRGIWAEFADVVHGTGESVAVGIGGGECTGKTYLAARLARHAESVSGKVISIPLDGYLRSTRDERHDRARTLSGTKARAVRIGDHPDCFEFGQLRHDVRSLLDKGCIETPRHYDYSVGRVVRLEEPMQVTGSFIVLVEGIFALRRELLDLYGTTIFITADRELVWQRYLERHSHRGTTMKESIAAFNDDVVPAYDEYIAPTRKNADMVVRANEHE